MSDHVARLALPLGFAAEIIADWPGLPDPPQAALEAEFEPGWDSSA